MSLETLVEVAVENLDHIIQRPQELYVEDEDGELSSLAVVDGEGTRHVVNLRQAVNLPGG